MSNGEQKKSGIVDFIDNNVRRGGIAGVIQIIISVALCIIACLTLNKYNLIWNIIVFNLPVTVDCFALVKKIPEKVCTPFFKKLMWGINGALAISLIYAFINAGMFLSDAIAYMQTGGAQAVKYELAFGWDWLSKVFLMVSGTSSQFFSDSGDFA